MHAAGYSMRTAMLYSKQGDTNFTQDVLSRSQWNATIIGKLA
jgi:hypothetical protein